MSDSLISPWTVAHQAPLSMGFSRPEYWSGLPFPSPGHLPNSGIEPGSPELQADSLLSEPPGKSLKYLMLCKCYVNSCWLMTNSSFALWNVLEIFFHSIFYSWLVTSADEEPKNMEDSVGGSDV